MARGEILYLKVSEVRVRMTSVIKTREIRLHGVQSVEHLVYFVFVFFL